MFVHSLSALITVVQLTAQELPPTLSRIEEIRKLDRETAAKAFPVRITGVVVWQMDWSFFIHDGSDSIWVSFSPDPGPYKWTGPIPPLDDWQPGSRVAIQGHTDPGGFAPMVLLTALEKLSTAPLPAAKRVSTERLLSGAEDSQFVEVEGVVRKIIPPTLGDEQSNILLMMVEGHPCYVSSVRPYDRRPEELIDARIRVRGSLTPLSNLRSQAAGLKLVINSAAEIEILVPPPAEPFNAPRATLKRLMPFSPDAELFHRKVTSGIVTFVIPGRFFYIQDEGISIRVETHDHSVKPGDTVEVAGFLDTSDILVSMIEAVVRVTGRQTPPAPVPADITKILNPPLRNQRELVSSTDENGRLVRLNAVLRRVLPGSDGRPATLIFEFEQRLFEAFLPVGDSAAAAKIASWISESTVELTGVCELEITREGSPQWFSISGFHLWLSSPDDLRVLRAPPWWTPSRLWLALGGGALAALFLVLWSTLLRRRVKAQTTLIGQQIQQVAVHEERSRLARDLHDEIGSQLARLSLLGQLLLDKADIAPKDHPRLQQLTRDVRAAAADLEQVIWAVDPQNDTQIRLVHQLCRYAEEYFSDTPITCTFGPLPEIPGRAIAPQSRATVISAFKEALANVLKHSAASNVNITFELADGRLECAVEDNGCGFDSAAIPEGSGNGLANIRQRLLLVRGEAGIVSRPGGGTRVTLCWSIAAARNKTA